MSAVRRRSSQYSLFPSCSPTPPLPNNPASSPSNGNIGNSRKLNKRHSEGSVRERAANISLRASLSTNDFPTNYDLASINHQQSKQSNNMDRLIPLKLEASMSDTKSSPTSQKFLPFLPLAELASIPIPAPLNPSKPTKRSRPGPVTDLTILPYTQKEWATIMEEVRMLYSKGQYKHCAMRCKQILDGIKDPVSSIYALNVNSIMLTKITVWSSASVFDLPVFLCS